MGDFTLHLAHLPRGGRRMVAFLGGTIGNLYLEERRAFLGALADVLEPGDSLLLGTDLVKSADRLIAAYNDSAGVTAEFVRNSLRVLNRELGADFDLDAFSYIPFWDAHMERMDLRLRSETPQRVDDPGRRPRPRPRGRRGDPGWRSRRSSGSARSRPSWSRPASG